MEDAPTPTEHTVIGMWAELLGTEPGGPHADFFELGGQSLTLLQFIARVQETFGVELPVEMLFSEDLTVALAARAIDEALLSTVADEELAALLEELDGMSDEQVQALLTDRGSA
ncbi:phosphopantetheine-binding protein [Pseudonocardia sp. TRM90224]|uniref:phosphopantetheine-binding protein n=1 Tax=Pseudonocardia sp. TRM90224 TaxID=2812678 RepID=UPI001E609F5A|nr:phosphopantetheine-binding protein [Pseudonocardia sp. TRM90224]